MSVFMFSQVLAEVSRLAKRIEIIHQGHLIRELGIVELELNRMRRLVLRTRDVAVVRAALGPAAKPAKVLPDATMVLTACQPD